MTGPHARRAATPPSPPPADARVAVVSGGNRGLGLDIVRALAEQGMHVVLGTRSLELGNIALNLLGEAANLVTVRQLDITDPASVRRLASWVERWFQRCDVLVNNAAVLLADDDEAATTDLDLAARTLETNVIGTWRLTQAVVPLMRARRSGRIVNISSGLGSLATMSRGLSAYRISKCAVNAQKRVLADELAEHSILVNACSPEPLLPDSLDSHGAVRLHASADTPVWLANLPDDGPTGGFYRERMPIEW